MKTCLVTLNVTNATDATIKLNSTSVTSSSNTIEVNKGDTVTWSVTRSNCVSQSGSITANEDTTKSITLKGNYTVNSNQGTPDVYFDGVKVGTISNGTLKVTSMDWKSAGYTVTLKNYTTKASEYEAHTVKIDTPVIYIYEIYLGHYEYEFEYAADSGLCIPKFQYYVTVYTPKVSGTCKSSITLNYSSSKTLKTTQNNITYNVTDCFFDIYFNHTTDPAKYFHFGEIELYDSKLYANYYNSGITMPAIYSVSVEGYMNATFALNVDGITLVYKITEDMTGIFNIEVNEESIG